MRALLLLGALLACGQGEVDGPNDRERYMAALDAGDPSLCEGIGDAGLLRECRVSGAASLAEAGEVEEALAICGELDALTWRDECYFLVSDHSQAIGEAAREICAKTGEFRQQCLGHATSREIAPLFKDRDPATFDTLLGEVEAVVGTYIAGGEVRAKSRRLTATHLASADPGQPFTAAHCGTAPKDLCVQAYIVRVREQSKTVNGGPADWRLACGSSVSVERAASIGLPTWEPELDEVVAQAWTQLCGTRGDRRRERPHAAPAPREP